MLTKKQYEKIMANNDRFAGLDIEDIPEELAGLLSKEDIRKFGEYFIEEGLRYGWLLDELGF